MFTNLTIVWGPHIVHGFQAPAPTLLGDLLGALLSDRGAQMAQ